LIHVNVDLGATGDNDAMSVLTVNLSSDLIDELNCLTRDLCSVANVKQALSYLEKHDVQYIIEDGRQGCHLNEDLQSLVAATPPGTGIYALTSNLFLPESEHWRSQGVTLIFDHSLGLLAKVLKSSELAS